MRLDYSKIWGFSQVKDVPECTLDTNNTHASTVFADLIRHASSILVSNLILGGAYLENTEDKQELLNHLSSIENILKKYTEQ